MKLMFDNTLLSFFLFNKSAGPFGQFVVASMNSVVRVAAIYVFIRVVLSAFEHGSF